MIDDRKKIDLAVNLHSHKNKEVGKKEALTVQRLIQEILVDQLNIPSRQIVNDTTFSEYTGSKRPDLLISEFEYDQERQNDTEFIENLVAYAEVKDGATVNDADWKDAIDQGLKKAPKLKLPYFIVTNSKVAIFYNVQNSKELELDGNPIRDFHELDILRVIKTALDKNPTKNKISTNIGARSIVSEAVFNKKLWELEKIYRGIKFENQIHKIDFTIGFISLKVFEEKSRQNKTLTKTKNYWSDCSDGTEKYPAKKITSSLKDYINWLSQESQFSEFHNLMMIVKIAIEGEGTESPIISPEYVKQIYDIINSMKSLHGKGFDLFGAVYEMLGSSKEKKDFGEYFTRRHYTYILSKLLLKDIDHFDPDQKFTILDPACGTGGFLTEAFKILRDTYSKTNTYTKNAQKFLESECFWGYDIRKENIARTKLNMFLVGDGHTNMIVDNTLEAKLDESTWKYVITNPPYGAGTVKAESSKFSSKRSEIAFLFRIIKILKDGGKACIIIPDGLLENPSLVELRKELMEKCIVDAIISLPKFAFAPYTKEKTNAIYITKKNSAVTKTQTKPIWMYIVDNDGLANSDKRFPTKLRGENNEYLHDEITEYLSNGTWHMGTLEERWMTYDDADIGGTDYLDEQGKKSKVRKAGSIPISNMNKNNDFCLLPEFHLRERKSSFITFNQLTDEITGIENQIQKLSEL